MGSWDWFQVQSRAVERDLGADGECSVYDGSAADGVLHNAIVHLMLRLTRGLDGIHQFAQLHV